jgi:hypothetical protein
MSVIDELLGPLIAGEELQLDLVNENSGYIASALETRFHLKSGGSYGGPGFSITHFPEWSSWNSSNP